MKSHKPVAKVMCEGEWVNVDDVEFVDISEDLFGKDLMTFRKDDKEYQSYIQFRP